MDLTRIKTEAKRLLDADDLPGAFRYAQLARNLDPRDPEVWILFADCHLRHEDFDEAIHGYEQALQLQPDNAHILHGLGSAYWKKGDLDMAAVHFLRARDADPNQLDYLADLGAVLVDQGRLDDGITLLEKSHLERPDSDRAQYFLGFSYIRKAYQDWIDADGSMGIPAGQYAPDRRSVRQAKEYKAKADALGSSNPELIKGLEELGDDVRRMAKRHLHGLWWLGLVYVAGGLAWAFANGAAAASLAALGTLFVLSCLAPGHVYYSRHLTAAGNDPDGGAGGVFKSIGNYLTSVADHGVADRQSDGLIKYVLTAVIFIILLPAITLWNLHRNYVKPGQKATGFSMMAVAALALSGFVTFAAMANRSGDTQTAAIGTTQNEVDTGPLSLTPDAPVPGAKVAEQAAVAQPDVAVKQEEGAGKITGIGLKAIDATSIQLTTGKDANLIKLSGLKAVAGDAAPEGQQQAAAFLTRLIKGQWVSCQSKDKKEYLCTLDDSGEDIAEAVILAGLAKPVVAAPAANGNPIAIKLYALQAGNFASGDPERVWKLIDPDCAFIDENGGQQPAQEVREKSLQFLSSIRNARIRYKIYNTSLSDDKLFVHAQSDLDYQTASQFLIFQETKRHLKTDMIMHTWQKTGTAWKIIESKQLRPESLRELEQSAAPAPPPEKAISSTRLAACAKQCSDTVMQCPREPSRNCPAEYRACIATCKQ